MSDRLLKESDVLKIAFQLPLVVNSAFADVVKALPSADRPQGEWVSNHDGSWNCSECGLRVLIYAKGNFCPNCGADMKGASK